MLSFILHYQEQIRLYDQLQPPNEQTSDHAKMIYLQNAVYAIEELRPFLTVHGKWNWKYDFRIGFRFPLPSNLTMIQNEKYQMT
jgi:hypothetical protein